MNALIALYQSLLYVSQQNLFWGSMSFTTCIGMFVGVLLFDGNIEATKKGMVATLSYGSMIAWTTFVRILPNAIENNFKFVNAQPFAGLATLIYITFFWILGVCIGVNIFKFKHFRE